MTLPAGKNRVQLQTPSGTVSTDYAFDTLGRISGLTNGSSSVTYGYLASSDLLQTTTSRSNTTTVLTTTRAWENGYRLRSIRNVAGGTVVSSHDYVYDALDRRRTATREDSSTWQYDYNNRDELISGKHFWNDYTPVAGQQFEYAYDSIGNGIQTKEGGDSAGSNLRAEGYGANNLNQITVRTNSGSTDLIGAAYTDAAVTVNSGPTTRQGEYFHRALPGGSSGIPGWQGVTNVASVSGSSETNTGSLLLPPNTQTFSYDFDGNLTSDGLWSYTWDMQNRLVSMTSLLTSPAPNNVRKKLEFIYNSFGCRVAKVVSRWNGSSFSNPETNKFIYSRRILLADLTATNSLLRSFSWGLDLAKSFETAGGVGGLVLVTDHLPATATYHFTAYDGNGNVTGLVQSSGLRTASYEYGPFGEVIQATGPIAKENPFRFSTKYTHNETDLVYYGFRYYSPSLGRWFGCDPLAETDFRNLYCFVGNHPIDGVDPFGLFTFVDILVTVAADYGSKTAEIARGITITSRVREVVKRLNAIESFKDGYMTASDMMDVDGTDMLERLASLRGEQAQGFRGCPSGKPQSLA